MDAIEAVRAASQHLDTKVRNWWDKVDTDTVDLTSDELCILGQIYGDFDHGVVDFFDGTAPRGLGLSNDTDALNERAEESTKKTAWLVEIMTRRAAVTDRKASLNQKVAA